MTVVSLPYIYPIESSPYNEGLPFWLFWFLLSLIGLLFFFIFLRNKELRRRIDFFFLRTKKRSLQIHLQQQMKRENKRKEKLWLEVGKIAYKNELNVVGTEALVKSLKVLERKKEEILAQLSSPSDHPQVDQKRKFPYSNNSPIKSLSEDKLSLKFPYFWPKKRAKLEHKLNALEKRTTTLLITLGKITDTQRVSHPELLPLYDKIDITKAKLSYLEQRLNLFTVFIFPL
ncbi:MAG: hypothetical protein N3B16_01350 [Candidatus Aminicenantes bacterium]|nr:hypothetical protein [Candidatus Aminicenantes bacterium]